jgi:hypothetical protein
MRSPRIKEAGVGYYHIISRVVDRRMVLTDIEKERFSRLRWAVARFSGCRVLAHSVMTNHWHMRKRSEGLPFQQLWGGGGWRAGRPPGPVSATLHRDYGAVPHSQRHPQPDLSPAGWFRHLSPSLPNSPRAQMACPFPPWGVLSRSVPGDSVAVQLKRRSQGGVKQNDLFPW